MALSALLPMLGGAGAQGLGILAGFKNQRRTNRAYGIPDNFGKTPDVAPDSYTPLTQNLPDETAGQVQNTLAQGAASIPGFSLSTATYSAVVEAWHEDVADQIRANSDAMINLDASATELVTQRLMIRRERRWMTQYFGTGIWGTDATPSNLWDTATGDPVADVDTAKSTIAGNTGMVPNTMVVSYPVFLKLRNNVRVRDQFKYTSADSINEAMLARLFDVQRFLVAKAVYASNKEGATAAYSFMAGKHALVCYVPPSPGLLVPSAGYIFAWSGYVGAKNGMRIKRFREEGKAADRIEGELAYDMKKVAANLGYFLNGVMS
jgi:hypothetical protein